jgi:hypothetical protein
VAIITTAEYQTITNESITGSLSTAYIEFILEAVSEDVVNWCGRSFGVQAVVNESVEAQAMLYNRQPVLRVQVKQYPVTAVTALAVWYAIDADPTTLSIDDAVIEAGGQAFLVPFGTFGLWQTFFNVGSSYRARTSYTAGETVPYTVNRAVALLAQEAFALDAEVSRSGTDDVESVRIGNYQEKKAARNLSASEGLGLGTQNSVSAAKALRRYRSEGVLFL